MSKKVKDDNYDSIPSTIYGDVLDIFLSRIESKQMHSITKELVDEVEGE